MVRYRWRVKYRHELTASITSHQCQFSNTLRATRKVANTLDQVTIESAKGNAAGVYRRKKYELTADRATMPSSGCPMAPVRPTAHRKRGAAPALPPLPKPVRRHGGVEGIQHRLHVQMSSEKHPYVETGTDERGDPALNSLPNRQKNVDHREHRRDDFDPTRVVPRAHELDRQSRESPGRRVWRRQAREHLHDEHQLRGAGGGRGARHLLA